MSMPKWRNQTAKKERSGTRFGYSACACSVEFKILRVSGFYQTLRIFFGLSAFVELCLFYHMSIRMPVHVQNALFANNEILTRMFLFLNYKHANNMNIFSSHKKT